MSEADTVTGVHCLIERKNMIRKSLRKIKKGKAARLWEIYIIRDLINLITVEVVTSAECQPSTIVNCFKEKGDALETGNNRVLNEQIKN